MAETKELIYVPTEKSPLEMKARPEKFLIALAVYGMYCNNEEWKEADNLESAQPIADELAKNNKALWCGVVNDQGKIVYRAS